MSKIGSGMSGMRKPEGLEPPCRASYPDSLRHKADISYIEDTDKEALLQFWSMIYYI